MQLVHCYIAANFCIVSKIYMKRFYFQTNKRIEKLTEKELGELVLDLVNAIVSAKSVGDAALFLQDLLTKSEIKLLAKRLRIAKLLIAGMEYREIEQNLHVGHTTIAKIAAWLAERGDGFRKIISSLPKQSDSGSWKEISEWDNFKRRYSLYFWPELLLEEVVKSANQRQKEKIRNILDRLEEKTELHKRVEKLLGY